MNDLASFKPFLESVTESSKRTRGATYLLIISSIAMIALFRNTFEPAWADMRLQAKNTQFSCWQKEFPANDVPCQSLKRTLVDAGRWPKDSIVPSDLPSRDELYGDVLRAIETNPALDAKEQMKARQKRLWLDKQTLPVVVAALDYAQKNTKLTRYMNSISIYSNKRFDFLMVSLPIVGVQFDANDFGVVAGISLFTLLLIFRTCVVRECENLLLAVEKSTNKDCLELLIAAQVFSQPRQRNFLGNALASLLLSIPVIILGTIVYGDYSTRNIGQLLMGDSFRYHLLWEEGGVLATLAASVAAVSAWLYENTLLDHIKTATLSDDRYEAYQASVEAERDKQDYKMFEARFPEEANLSNAQFTSSPTQDSSE